MGRVTQRTTFFLFGALALLFLGLTMVFLFLNRTSPTWDDAGYLTNSLILYDSLAEGGVLRYVSKFLTIMDIKPPLIAALPTPIYLIVGRHFRAAYLVNLVSMMVLFVAVFRIARRCSSARAGLLAVYLVATMPMVYGLSRWYLVECTLMAIVAMAICMVWESDQLTDTRRVSVAGLLCGTGLLLKFSFPLYILGPFLYCVLRTPWGKLRLKTVAVFVVPAVVLALPWYIVHFRSALATALDTGSAETAAHDVGRNVYSLAVVGTYLTKLLHGGPALYFAAVPVLVVLMHKRLSPGAREGLKLCAIWGAPLLFLVIWRSREARYAAPLYPALAIALALLTDGTLSRYGKWNRVLLGALLGLPLISMLQVSFGIFGNVNLELGGLLFNPQKLVYARRYDSRAWPYPEIVKRLRGVAGLPDRQWDYVLVGSDTAQFNADTVRLAAVDSNWPIPVMTLAYEADWNTARGLLNGATFFIYEEGGAPKSNYYNRYTKTAVREVQDCGDFVELFQSGRLPDGGVARVFQSLLHRGVSRSGIFLPAGSQTIPDGEVDFGGVFEISGIAFRQTDGAVEVKYRWRCLRPTDREYWCFTHIVDEEDKVAGYLDHRILNGNPSMATWKAGDMAIEDLHLHSPEIRAEKSYRLKVGLYDRTSGKRLTIATSGFPVTDGGTAAVVSGQR